MALESDEFARLLLHYAHLDAELDALNRNGSGHLVLLGRRDVDSLVSQLDVLVADAGRSRLVRHILRKLTLPGLLESLQLGPGHVFVTVLSHLPFLLESQNLVVLDIHARQEHVASVQ